MSKSTENTNGDIYNIQPNANETHNKNSPLIIHREIPRTPFVITGNEDRGYFVRLGDYRISDIQKTPEEAENELVEQHWNVIMRMIASIVERFNETREPEPEKLPGFRTP